MAATKATISKMKYDKTHMKQYLLKFNLDYDSDVIAKLDSMESKQGYIRQLIRADIAKSAPVSVPKTDGETIADEIISTCF